jgi:hypothetical protein
VCVFKDLAYLVKYDENTHLVPACPIHANQKTVEEGRGWYAISHELYEP